MVNKPYTDNFIVIDPSDPENKFLRITILGDGTAAIIPNGVDVELRGDLALASGYNIADDNNRTVDIQISSAELLALNTTPKTLVAAPGAGKVLLVRQAIWFLDYNSTAYDGIAAGEDLTIKYTNGSGVVAATCEATGFLDGTADKYAICFPAVNPGLITSNAALVAHMATGNIATGNSPLGVRLNYSVVDLSTLLAA